MNWITIYITVILSVSYLALELVAFEWIKCDCSDSDCKSLDEICCSTTPHFGCASTGKHLSIQLERNSPLTSINFYCKNLEPNEYPKSLQLGINNVHLRMINCPFPRNESHSTSLDELFKSLGIANVIKLQFETNEKQQIKPKPISVHFEGLKNLQKLWINGVNLTEATDDVFQELYNLSYLDLEGNNIPELKNYLLPLKNLTVLGLSDNSIKHLEPSFFKNFQRLQNLFLGRNKVRNINRLTFEDCDSLTILDLSSNALEKLDGDAFTQLPQLKILDLSSNRFSSIPAGLFLKNVKLVEIALNYNQVSLELPNHLFANLPKLEKIELVSNGLRFLANDIFKASNNLKYISIENNTLRSLTTGIFNDQENLITLNLSKNNLTEIEIDLLSANVKLEELILSENNLKKIERNALSTLYNLRFLAIDRNHLSILDQTLFRSNRLLKELHAEYNQLNFELSVWELASPLYHLADLEILDLSNNHIIKIFSDWTSQLTKLKIINLSFNHISKLSLFDLPFNNEESIKIDLRNNKISTIDFKKFDNSPIKLKSKLSIQYNLNKNPINCDCNLVEFAQFIQSHRQITFNNAKCSDPIPLQGKLISNIKYAELLCPYKDCSTDCICSKRSYDQTLIVECSNSNLITVPRLPNVTLDSMNSIILHIENNSISEFIGNNSTGFQYLTEVYASNNSMMEIHPNAIPKSLRVLNLSNNNLIKLEPIIVEILSNQTNFTKLFLGHNPWLCDCKTSDFIEYVKRNYETIKDIMEIKCDTGELISEINDVCVAVFKLLIALTASIALVGILVGLTAALYYKYQLEIKIWLYAHNYCLWLVTEAELDREKKYDAFVSYAHQDEKFVFEHLVGKLENGQDALKLCVHVRDWVAGDFIPDQVIRSVNSSRRTIIVLSQNFLQSVWGQMEFRAAHTAAMNEGRSRVIVIIYEEIGDIESLDEDLKAYLKMNTYIRWGDPWFWEKLRYAMPHCNKIFNSNTSKRNEKAIQRLLDNNNFKVREKMGTENVIQMEQLTDL